jgi:protein tyrosine/serine phosphatase
MIKFRRYIMRVIMKLSTYEAGELERFLNDYIKLKDFYYKHRKSNESKFNTLEYDKERINLLIRRLKGEDYIENFWQQKTEYKESLYPKNNSLEDEFGLF